MKHHTNGATDAHTLTILTLLADGDKCGFQLASLCGDTFRSREGELYALLHSLVRQRLLRSDVRVLPDGRERTCYRLTRSGMTFLRNAKEGGSV